MIHIDNVKHLDGVDCDQVARVGHGAVAGTVLSDGSSFDHSCPHFTGKEKFEVFSKWTMSPNCQPYHIFFRFCLST